jgi:hypothetical protein
VDGFGVLLEVLDGELQVLPDERPVDVLLKLLNEAVDLGREGEAGRRKRASRR